MAGEYADRHTNSFHGELRVFPFMGWGGGDWRILSSQPCSPRTKIFRKQLGNNGLLLKREKVPVPGKILAAAA